MIKYLLDASSAKGRIEITRKITSSLKSVDIYDLQKNARRARSLVTDYASYFYRRVIIKIFVPTS